ncbi:MAG: hypothetical protein MI919_25920 [Holophagales bacterium]|nr:hypothetical protein [Holophagales bacterium]
MPFQYTLANLLADNEGALAVLFLDETGETVDLACSEYTPYEMKIVGAYLGIYLRQLTALLEDTRFGTTEVLHIEKDEVHFLATPLPDGYYLVLVQRRPALLVRSRSTLLRARDEIRREIFG